MKKIWLTYFLLVWFCAQSLCAEDTIVFINREHNAKFKGVLCNEPNDSLYQGLLADSSTIYHFGFFTKDLSFQSYASFYSNCIELVTKDSDNDFYIARYNDLYIEKDNWLTNKYKDVFNDEDAFVGCKYNPDNEYWCWGTRYDDQRYMLYTEDNSYFEAGYHEWNDSGLKYVLYGPIIWTFWTLFLYDLIKIIFKKEKILLSLGISLLPTIFMYVLIPQDILYYQFFVPFVIYLVLWLGFLEYKSIRKAIKRLAYVVVALFVVYNNFLLTDNIKIGNEIMPMKWKAGTGVLKRYIIKNELEKLQNVTVDITQGGEYSFFVGKEVMSDGIFNAVIGSPFWWVSCLTGKLNESMIYREYIYFLDKLKELTGLDNFDLLRYDEFQYLSDNGLVNIEPEFKELTSSYKIRYQAIDEHRFIPIYDNIIYLDSACVDNNGKSNGVWKYKYKNAVLYDATARLVMRKNKKRHFDIMGIKVDNTNKFLPDSILLFKIDDMPIERLCYEKFEQFEIESYYKNHVIEYKTNFAESTYRRFMLAGKSYYWFIPIFYY